jgi:hypothetical protein
VIDPSLQRRRRRLLSQKTVLILFTIVFSLSSLSCKAVQEIGRALTNLSRCKFKLANVSDFQLAGIAVAGKSDFTIADGLTLASAFARNQLPATFTVNVAAMNPNDGTGGTPKSSATLTSFAWTLLIDNAVTINGDIASPITIPGTGQESVIPLRMNLDLFTFFRDKGYDHILNLALALGGAHGSPTRITLRARPTISTDFGPITYPNDIDIIDREFR